VRDGVKEYAENPLLKVFSMYWITKSYARKVKTQKCPRLAEIRMKHPMLWSPVVCCFVQMLGMMAQILRRRSSRIPSCGVGPFSWISHALRYSLRVPSYDRTLCAWWAYQHQHAPSLITAQLTVTAGHLVLLSLPPKAVQVAHPKPSITST
jgi:hypothetical protein